MNAQGIRKYGKALITGTLSRKGIPSPGFFRFPASRPNFQMMSRSVIQFNT